MLPPSGEREKENRRAKNLHNIVAIIPLRARTFEEVELDYSPEWERISDELYTNLDTTAAVVSASQSCFFS